jgi:hypothetical protein
MRWLPELPHALSTGWWQNARRSLGFENNGESPPCSRMSASSSTFKAMGDGPREAI